MQVIHEDRRADSQAEKKARKTEAAAELSWSVQADQPAKSDSCGFPCFLLPDPDDHRAPAFRVASPVNSSFDVTTHTKVGR